MKPPRVVLTASDSALPGLVDALNAAGFAAVHHPLVVTRPPSSWQPVDSALATLDTIEALVFTSPRAVHTVLARLEVTNRSFPATLQVWAPAGATAAALASAAPRVRTAAVSAVGRDGAAVAVAAAMLAGGVRGPVIFFCGDPHRPSLPDALRLRGAECFEVVCYRTTPVAVAEAVLALKGAAAVVAASPLAVQLIAEALPASARPELIAIGPTTAAAARAVGWEPAAVAAEPTANALAAAARSLFATR